MLKQPGVEEVQRRAIREALAIKRGEPEPEDAPLDVRAVRPVRITVPWDHLATDNYNELVNRKLGVYTAAKARFRADVSAQYDGRPIEAPVHVDVALYLPNLIEIDPTNFWKLIGDSIKGLLVKDDSWRHMADSRIRVAGLDRANPRLVLTVVGVEEAPAPVRDWA